MSVYTYISIIYGIFSFIRYITPSDSSHKAHIRMYACMCVCIYIYIYIYMCMYIHAFIHIYV
jgi:hypothetical protein